MWQVRFVRRKSWERVVACQRSPGPREGVSALNSGSLVPAFLFFLPMSHQPWAMLRGTLLRIMTTKPPILGALASPREKTKPGRNEIPIFLEASSEKCKWMPLRLRCAWGPLGSLERGSLWRSRLRWARWACTLSSRAVPGLHPGDPQSGRPGNRWRSERPVILSAGQSSHILKVHLEGCALVPSLQSVKEIALLMAFLLTWKTQTPVRGFMASVWCHWIPQTSDLNVCAPLASPLEVGRTPSWLCWAWGPFPGEMYLEKND